MSSCVFLPGLVEQDHLVDVRLLELAQPARGSCPASRSARTGAAACPLGVCFHVEVLLPQVHGARLDRTVRVVEDAGRTGRTSSPRPAAAPPRRSSAHMKPRHDRDVRVGRVVAQLARAASCRRCSRRSPTRAPPRRDTNWKPSAPMPRRPAISIVSSWLHATHSGGCGFCKRLRHDVAQREVEVLAVVLPALLAEHRHARTAPRPPTPRACRGSGGRTGAAR